jgi:hypothetical protein
VKLQSPGEVLVGVGTCKVLGVFTHSFPV